ncbi:ABC transporter ATP-binding protein [Geotoga petraea]|uniref:NitT/TauT family transport system ATP-binding protein n=1 Tax=Geotoga petraea TaxID=28234 RepID=A0A1G6PJ86_9BACT|nr:ABC transporter ATP-binding protein [Geotoga petraea]SDC79644.1 NitT/TauT family transport system ATP-binding protein [Geotoga petraea]
MIDIKIKEKKFDNLVVLKNINFKINEGEFISILGPSGCGKSTLLRTVGGFEDFDGTIKIEERIKEKPGRDVIMVFQDFNQLFPWLTIEKNILFALKHDNKNLKEHKSIAKEYINLVGLKDYADYYPHQLSGGMKQRAAIARALALKPTILLMDEPFAALDAQTRTILQQELLKIWEKVKTTIIFVTHNIQESIILGDKIVVMGTEPGHISKIYNNNLTRPRRPDTEGFTDLWHDLYTNLDQKRFLEKNVGK